MENKIPKIIRLERQCCIGIVNLVDSLLDKGISYRKIAKEVIKKYLVGISYESIRDYDLYRKGLRKEKQAESAFYIKTAPLRPTRY